MNKATTSVDVLYRKEGRRYVPVQLTTYDNQRFPKGTHLVVADLPNRTIYRYNVDNVDAAVLAALVRCEDHLVEALWAQLSIQPSRPPITAEQRAAWEKFVEVMGDSGRTITYKSTQQAVSDALRSINARVEETLVDQRVIEAYEKFKTVVTMISPTSEDK